MTTADIARAFARLSRRTRVSVIVMGVTLALGGVLFLGGEHLVETWGQDAQRLQQEVTRVEGEAMRLRRDIEFVQQNTGRYEQVLARGLFGERNRLLARRALERQLASHRLQGDITLHPRSQGPSHRIAGTEYRMLTAPVVMAADGMLDADLFDLMGDIGGSLPGYLVLESAVLTREDVTPEKLQTLRSGLPVPLVRGRLTYHWLSAAPAASGEATQ
ncbi:hypothetical protein C882_3317 [Caenispirillum salinarum AK4]|uniref:Uncharacterized protein n=1 Tax=Caenispirillum salinarum AK4 TaxID=1238182 RepID=K9HPQ5_9PROT|nr:hypothetical protein [Caenispirillum salinarum]EKV32253.1 hypothetical protein C882_3317 [Caenispirillum salinarum AK4]